MPGESDAIGGCRLRGARTDRIANLITAVMLLAIGVLAGLI
jgi:hypothetical protein